FYLDRANEAGAHWRAGLLGFAKWPWFLLALLDVVTARRVGYTITNKSERQAGYPPFVRWHVALAIVMAAAVAVSRTRGTTSAVLEGVALVVAVVAVALAAHGARIPPPPF